MGKLPRDVESRRGRGKKESGVRERMSMDQEAYYEEKRKKKHRR
jgi:hypothetical protein